MPRRLAIPLATALAYGTLVALSALIGVRTDWEESPLSLPLYAVPHVALGVAAVVLWRWAPLLIVLPVALAVPYSEFGCGTEGSYGVGIECLYEPRAVFVLVGVGLLVLIGLAVGAILRASVLDRAHDRTAEDAD
jgi:hypothetical protein